MKNIFLKIAGICLTTVCSSAVNAEDFSASFSEITAHPAALQNSCDRIDSEQQMDEGKATALVLWVGLCQPQLAKTWLTNSSMYFYKDGRYYVDRSHTEEASEQDLMSSYFAFFGNIEVQDSMPTNAIPFQIIEYPLIVYGHDSAGDSVKVWTNFPMTMPIGSLLQNPTERKLFCESAELPQNEFYLSKGHHSGYGPMTCQIPGLDGERTRSVMSLPVVPPPPKGGRNLVCHHLRIRAARAGHISHNQLFDLTRENSVPVFKDVDNPLSEMVGTEPCVINSVVKKVKRFDEFQFSSVPGLMVNPSMQMTPLLTDKSATRQARQPEFPGFQRHMDEAQEQILVPMKFMAPPITQPNQRDQMVQRWPK